MLDSNSLIFSLAIIIGVAIVALVIFPIEQTTTTRIYDYQTHTDRYATTTNYTAVYIILVVSGAVVLWLVSKGDRKELTVVRTLTDVLYDPQSSGHLSAYNVILPCIITHQHLFGESSIGSLGFGSLVNDDGNTVYVMAILNDNYMVTEARQRFVSPIIGITMEPLELTLAFGMLRYSERKNMENQLKNAIRFIKAQGSTKRELLMQDIEKAEEDEQNAGNKQ